MKIAKEELVSCIMWLILFIVSCPQSRISFAVLAPNDLNYIWALGILAGLSAINAWDSMIAFNAKMKILNKKKVTVCVK
jgi:hypothetical protein